MKTLLTGVAVAVVVLSGAIVGVMLFRSATLNADPIPAGTAFPFDFDELGAPERLAGALRFATISRGGPEKADSETWTDLHDYLEQSFPRTHASLERQTISGLSLLYRWPGSDPALEPILLTAHMDVVAAEEEGNAGWRVPAFAGEVEGGYVWGRGAIDNKGSIIGILESVEGLLESGFVPRRTILLAFGHDGESSGEGVRQIAGLLRQRGLSPAWILGEGLYLVTGMIPGVRDPVAMVGVAEKTGMDLRLVAHGEEGSLSAPPRHTALGILSTALTRLEDGAFPAEIRGPGLELLQTLGPRMDPGTRLLVANLWLLRRPLARALTESPILRASLHTTVAPAAIEADPVVDRLPSEVSARVQVRIAPWDTPESVLERIRELLSDLNVDVEVLDGGTSANQRSETSPTDSEGFRVLQEAIHRSFADVIAVVPALVPGTTDSRHLSAISDQVYGFSPFRVDEETLETIHGAGERVRVSVYLDAVRFYAELIRRGTE